eukprot:14158277-Alexandrium_andersonii.AAC.1
MDGGFFLWFPAPARGGAAPRTPAAHPGGGSPHGRAAGGPGGGSPPGRHRKPQEKAATHLRTPISCWLLEIGLNPPCQTCK